MNAMEARTPVNQTIFIGCDPGVSGALAFSFSDDAIALHDIPSTKPGKFRAHDSIAIQELLDQYQVSGKRAIALIESVHVDWRDSSHIKSAEVLIRCHEAVRTLLQINGVGVIDAAPVQWRKTLGIVGGDKEGAIALALQLFPSVRDQVFYKSRNGRYAKNHNRAEALLMMYAARLLSEKSNAA